MEDEENIGMTVENMLWGTVQDPTPSDIAHGLSYEQDFAAIIDAKRALEFIRTLPYKQRVAVEHLIDGTPAQETAELLHVSIGYVRQLRWQGLRTVRRHFHVLSEETTPPSEG
jgi:DNA-directed RNA polymerase specialized sigma24 family protein